MSAGTALISPADLDARAVEVARATAQATAQAEAMQVRDPAEADVAAELLKQIAKRKRAAEAERVELTKPLLDHKRLIDQKFKDAMAPFAAADEIVRGKLGTYTAEQERIRRAEEARLEAERQERERKAREARERQEAEERAKREQAEREAREAEEEAKAAKDAADAEVAEKLAEEARQKAEEAKTAEAAIAALPEVQLPTAVVQAPPKQEGISGKTKREITVEDFDKLPRFLPDGTPLIVVDMVALRKWANGVWSETGEPPTLPGVKCERVPDGIAVRT